MTSEQGSSPIPSPQPSSPQPSSPQPSDPQPTDSQNTAEQSNQPPNGGFQINIEYSDNSVSDAEEARNHPQEARNYPQEAPQTNASLENAPPEYIPPNEPPLYFLSVNYYSAALLSDLMHTLEANQGIVIVNNSPADRIVHGLAGQTYGGGEVTVLDAPENDGFGSGCNLGLQWIYARSPNALVWLINPDTSLMPNAVDSIRQCFRQQVQDQNIDILGTPILDSKGKLWFGSGQFNRWTGSVSTKAVKDARGRPTPTQWVSGCSMILNLDELGHCPQFDDAYFLYYEDCDLCERYLQQGRMIAIAPVPLVVHAVSSITSRYPSPKYVYATFSKLTFLHRHATSLALWLNLIYLFAQAALLRFIKPALAQGRWIGLKHFLSGS